MPLEDVPPPRNEKNEAHRDEETCPRCHNGLEAEPGPGPGPVSPSPCFSPPQGPHNGRCQLSGSEAPEESGQTGWEILHQWQQAGKCASPSREVPSSPFLQGTTGLIPWLRLICMQELLKAQAVAGAHHPASWAASLKPPALWQIGCWHPEGRHNSQITQPTLS